MTVGNRVFSGKGAREEAAKALTLHSPLVARRSNDAVARSLSRLRDSEQGEERRIRDCFKTTSGSRNSLSGDAPRIPQT